MVKTTDSKAYYGRVGTKKSSFVFDFVSSHDDIDIVFDVGCNNGDMSYPLQKKLNKVVCGIDLSDDLRVPDDYNFRRTDIVNEASIFLNDATLFFSLYHHILGKYGLKVADKIFLKLLMRTEYLLFDVGNLSEKHRRHTYWYKEQLKHFSSEEDLLNHFNLPYEVIGSWNCGGGKRNVVVFKRNDFDDSVHIEGVYRRLVGSKYTKRGLVPENTNMNEKYEHTVFYQIKWNNVVLFGKKLLKSHPFGENNELNNIIDLYSKVDPSKLVPFYGTSNKYGLLFDSCQCT